MTLQTINTIVVSIGVPAIVVALVTIGVKLHTLTTIEAAVEKVKHNMKVMGDYLTRHHAKFDPNELRAFSPLQLTDAGNAFITDTGFDNIFATNRSEFLEFIDSEKPLLKYDVEVASTKSIYVFSDKSYMQFLKVYFYNHPNRNMENTAPTLGVYVRDKYLEEHPEITQ